MNMQNLFSFGSEPGFGRHIDKSDPNAPKKIVSRKIVEFSAYFYTHDPFNAMQKEFYRVFVQKEENGEKLIFSGIGGRKLETDEAFLESIQEVIEKNDLVSLNGKCEYSEGLPPEFQPYTLTAVYDSGEKLSFTVAGYPSYPWGLDLRKAFCEELLRHGIEDLLPPKADRNVVRLSMEINKWPVLMRYWTIRVDEGQDEKVVHYMRDVWNKADEKSEYNKIITVPDDFYDHITELVEQTEYRDYCNGKIDFADEFASSDKGASFVKISAEGESGRQFNTFITGDEIPEKLYRAADVIKEYIDSVFESKGEMPAREFNELITRLTESAPPAPKPSPRQVPEDGSWQCLCGCYNTGSFCTSCGSPKR